MFFSKIKLSVIIPCYNPNMDLLRQALNSCFEQTLKNTEIIIIDDGSEFDFRKKLNLKNIKYFKIKENKGSGIARNIGIKHSKGKYIAFLDSDDYFFSSDCLEKLYNIAEKTKLKVVGAKPYQILNGTKEPIFWSFKNYENLFNNIYANVNNFQICYGFWNFIYERNFLIENNLFFPDLSRYQDPIFLFNVLNKAQTFYAADFPFYVHRVKNILNFNWSKKQLQDYFAGITELVKKSKDLKFYDLHTFLYRKALFWEFNLLKKSKDKLNIDVSDEFENFINSFDFEIIKKTQGTMPVLKSINDFNKFDFDKYSHLDY